MGCKVDFERQNAVFQDWKQRPLHVGRSDFITDGPVDPGLWAGRTSRRVLFLAKEAYGGGGDLCAWLREDIDQDRALGKLFWRIGYWNYGIQRLGPHRLPTNPPYKRFWEETREALRESAIVNIKKSNGQTASNVEDLRRYLKEDGDLIKEQVACLCPDIMICCSTWHMVRHLWPQAEEVSERVWQSADSDLLIVNFWHPSSWGYRDALFYYGLMGLLQQAMFPEKNRGASVTGP